VAVLTALTALTKPPPPVLSRLPVHCERNSRPPCGLGVSETGNPAPPVVCQLSEQQWLRMFGVVVAAAAVGVVRGRRPDFSSSFVDLYFILFYLFFFFRVGCGLSFPRLWRVCMEVCMRYA